MPATAPPSDLRILSGSDETTAQGQEGSAVNAVPIDNAGKLTHYIEVRQRAQDIHTGDDGNPVGLSEILRNMGAALEVQMKEEEQRLFPAIRSGALSGIGDAIAAMRVKRRDLDRDIVVSGTSRGISRCLRPPAQAGPRCMRVWRVSSTT